MGWLWVMLMVYVAVSSIFINEFRIFGPFSPIHLLIFVTLAGLFYGVRAIRKKQVEAHKRSMMSVFFLALVLTGLFTLWPGRTMHLVLFGS